MAKKASKKLKLFVVFVAIIATFILLFRSPLRGKDWSDEATGDRRDIGQVKRYGFLGSKLMIGESDYWIGKVKNFGKKIEWTAKDGSQKAFWISK